MGLDTKTYWLTNRQSQCDFDFDLPWVLPVWRRGWILHRDPASRRRRRKGKSQIWDSKMWSWVPRDSNPRKIALARASSIYKRQTRPLVREDAPQKQDRNCNYPKEALRNLKYCNEAITYKNLGRIFLSLFKECSYYAWSHYYPIHAVNKLRAIYLSIAL
jgi:hypothetical protein